MVVSSYIIDVVKTRSHTNSLYYQRNWSCYWS